MAKFSQLKRANYWHNILLFSVLFLSFVIPRFLVLKQTITVDEPKWIIRAANFGYALSNRDFAQTNQRGHPGVTIMWAGQTGLKLLIPEYGQIGKQNISDGELEALVQQNDHEMIDILAWQRVFVILINSIAMLIVFYYSRWLLGKTTSIIAFLLFAFSPFVAAHTKLMQLDGPSAIFILLSLVAILYHLKSKRWTALVVSGIAAGLAWLSRSPTLALIPAIGLILFLNQLQQYRLQKISVIQMLSKTLGDFLIWLVLGSATFVILWPAMWVTPVTALVGVYENIFKATISGHPRPEFFAGRLTEPGVTHLPLYYYPVTYIWRSSPIVSLGLFFGLIAFLKKSRPFNEQSARLTVWAFLIFVVVFTMAMAVSNKKHDRYLLPIYGPLMFIASGGWVALTYWFEQKFSIFRKNKFSVISILSLVVLFQLLFLIQVHPYYLSYYNAFLGGPAKAQEVFQIGWGEGLDAAARYLNQKEGAETFQVASWYDASFRYFFEGQSLDIPSEINEAYRQQILNSDYIVIYIHQWQRQLPAGLLLELESRQPEHTIWINDIPYAQIYKIPGQP